MREIILAFFKGSMEFGHVEMERQERFGEREHHSKSERTTFDNSKSKVPRAVIYDKFKRDR